MDFERWIPHPLTRPAYPIHQQRPAVITLRHCLLFLILLPAVLLPAHRAAAQSVNVTMAVNRVSMLAGEE